MPDPHFDNVFGASKRVDTIGAGFDRPSVAIEVPTVQELAVTVRNHRFQF